MARRTKIIATIGPASADPVVMRDMMRSGMDVARIGLAHGTLEQQLDLYHGIRRVAAEDGHYVGILVDLPGPKIRCGSFPDGGVFLVEGSMIEVVAGTGGSTAERITVDYETIVEDILLGDRIAFADGNVVAEVESIDADVIKVRVVHGASVQGRPGLHVPSDRLRLTAPTANDLRLLDAFVDAGVDMIALSFVRSAHDLRKLGVESAPRGPLVIAKVETRAAVENLFAIIEASGAIMVARGDLGSECPIEELPHLQKRIIRECIAHGRPAITATQMLESMISAPGPTRAEASDVANAVFDGSSALMLSGETAIGHDPVLVVRTMSRIAERADTEFGYDRWGETIGDLRMKAAGPEGARVTDALTMSAWRAAHDLDAKAIICLTQTGFTVRSVARFRPKAKILGFSPNERTVHQLALSWGARPILAPSRPTSQEMTEDALRLARDRGELRSGDLVVVVAGTTTRSLSTDTLRVVHVP
jgi:pyruvate kinase